jgi:hypothetical protein
MRLVIVAFIGFVACGYWNTAIAEQGSPSARIVVEPPVSAPQTVNPWAAACRGRTTSYSGIGQSYWLGGGGSTLTYNQQLDADRVVTVSSNRSRAIHMLARRSFVRLTRAELEAFTGAPINSSFRRDLRPYLVRSVGAQDTTLARWDGHNLEVIGIAMGECPSLANRPVIVLLERRPRHVLVDTIGAD